jgi:hypothetical protein
MNKILITKKQLHQYKKTSETGLQTSIVKTTNQGIAQFIYTI